MFPGVELKISPNGLYRLFGSCHPVMVSAPVPDDAIAFGIANNPEELSSLSSPAWDPLRNAEKAVTSDIA
jgi:hypothetical protein